MVRNSSALYYVTKEAVNSASAALSNRENAPDSGNRESLGNTRKLGTIMGILDEVFKA
jgi:hypothetical protein